METMAPADGKTVEVVDGVHLTQLCVGESMSAQQFHIEPGATVPKHSHHHEQIGVVLTGTMTLVVDDAEHVVASGESYVVPSEETHTAENRGEEPIRGIDVFSPPREDPDWMD